MQGRLGIVLFCVGTLARAGGPSVQEILERSVQAMNQDWKAIAEYAYVERDVESKHGRAKTIKTHRVVMIDGSRYNELIAVNDEPLSPQMKSREEKKLASEIVKRKHETAAERSRRIAKYQKERTQDHQMMQQMTKAFRFKMAGEPTVGGYKTWCLDAEPNPSYVPPSAELRVLQGMKGRLWVEQEHYHWVQVQAEVTRPVSLYGFLAKVQPGTRFVLEQAPVTAGVWLPKHFRTDVRASALGFIDENSTDDQTYTDYQQPAESAIKR